MPKRVYWVKPKTQQHKLVRLVNLALVVTLGGSLAVVLTAVGAYLILGHDLPKLDSLDDYRPNVVSYVYDSKGKVVGEFKYENQRRILLTFEQIPKQVIDAIVAAEDAAFWKHEGLDYMGMVRALLVNIRKHSWTQGGSTITQQVTRSLLLTKEKKLARKIKEMILAQQIEQKLSKQDILLLYLNEIYFGNGAYGIQAAAQNYFDKNVDSLTLSEASVLAGLPQAPSRYSPYWNASAARVRQKYVLDQMVEENYITRPDAEKALAAPWDLKEQGDINLAYAPCFVEHIRRYVMKTYGAKRVLKEGLKIYTTLDTRLQAAADRAVDAGLRELDKRHGWRGPIKTLSPEQVKPYLESLAGQQKSTPRKDEILQGLVVMVGTEQALVNVGVQTGKLPVKGARWIDRIKKGRKETAFRVRDLRKILKVHDVIEVKVAHSGPTPVFDLDQPPGAQAALLAMEPATRYVRAMVGGRDFSENQFNRAVQANRQPGSSFKPIVYAAAIDAGMTPSTIIMDTALVFKDGWRPANYDGRFKGELTLRQALTKSVNTVTIRIVDRISADYVYRYAHRLGISALSGADLSMALGTYEIPPIQLINAYAVFASGGKLADPIFIKKIEGREGQILEQKILTTDVVQVAPMADVPDVSDWGQGVDLEQGADEYATVGDPVARRQFFEDFNLDSGTKKKSDKPLIDIGKTLPDADKVTFTQVVSPQTAFLITSIMHSVATSGTGARTNALGKIVAGKTGTTNDYVDAWFIGFSPDLLAGVWVGNDAGSLPLGSGESGSKAALPIWLHFMKKALEDAPNNDFDVPQGITVAKIDPKTGLLANPETKGAFNEYFKSGTEPIQYSPSSDTINPQNFFEVDLE